MISDIRTEGIRLYFLLEGISKNSRSHVLKYVLVVLYIDTTCRHQNQEVSLYIFCAVSFHVTEFCSGLMYKN